MAINRIRVSWPGLLLGMPLMALLFCFCSGAAESASSTVAGYPQETALKLGERMYRHGVLPSGEPMEALVQGDIPVDSTMFSCVSCHLRSGIGSIEGSVATPPTDGLTLYRPVGAPPGRWFSQSSRERLQRSALGLGRPAYTDETLATAIRGGINPSGKTLNYTMPRYMLNDQDMEIMIHYLKNLSVSIPPGVTRELIRFATVFTADVSKTDRDSVLNPLDLMVSTNNGAGASRMTARTMAADPHDPMAQAYRKISLARWELKGPPSGWRKQLETYYKKEPVFALLGGMSSGSWQPIHQFCEDNRIPCILPITDLPVVSETDWYTIYFSKGLYQEGEAAANYLQGLSPATENIPVVQLYRNTPQGLALAKGFNEAWTQSGHKARNIVLKEHERITKSYWKKITASAPDAILIIWLDAKEMAAIKQLSELANKPKMVFLSSTLMKKAVYEIPDALRKQVYITHPQRIPSDFARFKPSLRGWLARNKLSEANPEVQAKMVTIFSTVPQAIFMMKGYFVRDRFLEVIDMMAPMQPMEETASTSPLYPRFSFGPGQRYASKGCFITQLTEGPAPDLIAVSDWVIY